MPTPRRRKRGIGVGGESHGGVNTFGIDSTPSGRTMVRSKGYESGTKGIRELGAAYSKVELETGMVGPGRRRPNSQPLSPKLAKKLGLQES